MIKTNGQYIRTKSQLEEMISERDQLIEGNPDKDNAKFKFTLSSFEAIIEDLEVQLNEYEPLAGGGLHIIQPKGLEDLPKAIIQARIALNLTQKQFAERVGLKEQQIQRYESEDYQGASLDRIIDFCEALQIKFYFEKTIIHCERIEIFSFGNDITEEVIEAESRKVKLRGSLLIA